MTVKSCHCCGKEAGSNWSGVPTLDGWLGIVFPMKMGVNEYTRLFCPDCAGQIMSYSDACKTANEPWPDFYDTLEDA